MGTLDFLVNVMKDNRFKRYKELLEKWEKSLKPGDINEDSKRDVENNLLGIIGQVKFDSVIKIMFLDFYFKVYLNMGNLLIDLEIFVGNDLRFSVINMYRYVRPAAEAKSDFYRCENIYEIIQRKNFIETLNRF